MAQATLDAIRTKVRRLTRSPSESLLTTAQLDEYINTFILYDMPEHLRMFKNHAQFSFYTNPYQDVYPTDTISFAGVTTNPLYNFQNKVLTINPPVYIAGLPCLYAQSQQEFFNYYPKIMSVQSIGITGDGVTTTFSGTVTGVSNGQQGTVLVKNQVVFSSVDSFDNGLTLVDVPVVNILTGNQLTEGNLYVPGTEPTTPPVVVDPNNTINYKTGAFTITFPSAPASGQAINSQTLPQVTAMPRAMLYYNNTFTLRPVPDQPYKVNFEVYIRPTELLQQTDTPQLEEWWQYIAYGAAKKVFEDRTDIDSVALIDPEFKQQELLCQRRTLVQLSTQRSATIYSDQTGTQGGLGGFDGWGWGGPF